MEMRRLAACLAFTSISDIKPLTWRRRALSRDVLTRSVFCSMSTSPHEDDRNHLQDALKKAEERALDSFITNEAPSWLNGRSTMPFQCTACGKCCQTKGDVYMSPDEVVVAAHLMGRTPSEFVETYASHLLGPSKTFVEGSSWIRLSEKGESCVFLGDDGKLCTIYEARPVQCRTYPFWPAIMQSIQSWDEECRRKDEDIESPLPPWSRQSGGCEGMEIIEESLGHEEDAVPLREAYRQLYQYIISERRFPKGTERPLNPRLSR